MGQYPAWSRPCPYSCPAPVPQCLAQRNMGGTRKRADWHAEWVRRNYSEAMRYSQRRRGHRLDSTLEGSNNIFIMDMGATRSMFIQHRYRRMLWPAQVRRTAQECRYKVRCWLNNSMSKTRIRKQATDRGRVDSWLWGTYQHAETFLAGRRVVFRLASGLPCKRGSLRDFDWRVPSFTLTTESTHHPQPTPAPRLTGRPLVSGILANSHSALVWTWCAKMGHQFSRGTMSEYMRCLPTVL